MKPLHFEKWIGLYYSFVLEGVVVILFNNRSQVAPMELLLKTTDSCNPTSELSAVCPNEHMLLFGQSLVRQI